MEIRKIAASRRSATAQLSTMYTMTPCFELNSRRALPQPHRQRHAACTLQLAHYETPTLAKAKTTSSRPSRPQRPHHRVSSSTHPLKSCCRSSARLSRDQRMLSINCDTPVVIHAVGLCYTKSRVTLGPSCSLQQEMLIIKVCQWHIEKHGAASKYALLMQACRCQTCLFLVVHLISSGIARII
jgi:hypothetical protein